jgi:hypothetical protein
MHASVSSLGDDIVEPDWTEFRSSVRDALLSRSVQRASVVRRWTGWPLQPAFAWALSLVAAVGITAGAMLWWTGESAPAGLQPGAVETVYDPQPSEIADEFSAAEPAEFNYIANEIDLWSEKHVFEELTRLEAGEAEALRLLLEAAQEETAERE